MIYWLKHSYLNLNYLCKIFILKLLKSWLQWENMPEIQFPTLQLQRRLEWHRGQACGWQNRGGSYHISQLISAHRWILEKEGLLYWTVSRHEPKCCACCQLFAGNTLLLVLGMDEQWRQLPPCFWQFSFLSFTFKLMQSCAVHFVIFNLLFPYFTCLFNLI